MLNKIIGAMTQVAEGAGTIVGIRSGTEEPPYTVERRIGDVEIRRYGPRIAAQTAADGDEEAARNAGFRRLAGYIFGGNTAKAKIAMTAPVAQQNEKIAMTAPVASQRGADGQWVIRFFMPSKYTLETLPTPNDERVQLVTVAPERVAVLRFSGTIGPATVTARTQDLLNTLRDNGIEPTGDPMGWFYDPPWTVPFLRRNEVVVSIGADGTD